MEENFIEYEVLFHDKLGLCKVEKIEEDGIWVTALFVAPKVKVERKYLRKLKAHEITQIQFFLANLFLK